MHGYTLGVGFGAWLYTWCRVLVHGYTLGVGFWCMVIHLV